MNDSINIPPKRFNRPIGDETRLTTNRRRAMKLRLRGMTLKQIGKELGVSHQTISNYIGYSLRQLAALTAEDTEEYRTLELARLDALQIALWPKATNGNVWAVDRVLAIMERRAKMLGLDKPLAHIIAGDKDNPIEIEQKAAIDAELVTIFKQMAERLGDPNNPAVEHPENPVIDITQ